MENKSTFEIILGTYEQFVLGFFYDKKANELTQSFATHSHSGSVRCVSYNKGILASGGTDDHIIIYNLKTRREQSTLNHHSSTITCLQFTNKCSHLLSGCQDGSLGIVRVGSWQLEKLWEKAHRDVAVVDIAVHQSNKLALTLGADGILKTWNLVKGRTAYIINLNSKCKDARTLNLIKFCPNYESFLLTGSTMIYIWSLESGGLIKSIENKSRVVCCDWLGEKLIVGYENGSIGVVDVESDEIEIHEAHSARVKCLAVIEDFIVSASSDGKIIVWDKELNEMTTHSAECRFTCMSVVLNAEVTDASKVVEISESNDNDVDDEEIEAVSEEEQEIKVKRKNKSNKEKNIKKKK
ncbi:PREDICTED: p21-activated protein kinase-interacting protein 1-like, partial [Nicrophorus vespilloides]|uniref:P21-activated protein kinase-interacting protein 1-like n=1 Tax=Nicrophorus vespilloides TaxID=110193 RepID=A0ABM1N3T8_NICVS